MQADAQRTTYADPRSVLQTLAQNILSGSLALEDQ
jgi:hypothetical protein